MQTLSSASRTCMASASAVECTATVAMPTSLQARKTLSAISPRLAIKTFSNIAAGGLPTLLDDRQRLAELDRLAVADKDGGDHAGCGGGGVVHGLHRRDDEDRVARRDARAALDEGGSTRLSSKIGGADHRRGHGAGAL